MSKEKSAGDPQKNEARGGDAEAKYTQPMPALSVPEKPKTEEAPKKKPPITRSAPEPKPAAPQAPKVAKAEKPVTRVKLDVFCKLTGLKFDKLAGFRYIAKKQKLGPMAVPEWWAEFDKYQKRPVG